MRGFGLHGWMRPTVTVAVAVVFSNQAGNRVEFIFGVVNCSAMSQRGARMTEVSRKPVQAFSDPKWW